MVRYACLDGFMLPERNFVSATSGSCSFCSKDRTHVRSLLGVADRATQVCDQCVALGWDLIANEVGLEPPSDLHGRVNFDDARYQAHIAEVQRRLTDEREARKVSSFDPGRVAHARATMPEFRCSFCDAHRVDAIKIIAGPGAFICDACIDAATAVVVGSIRS